VAGFFRSDAFLSPLLQCQSTDANQPPDLIYSSSNCWGTRCHTQLHWPTLYAS